MNFSKYINNFTWVLCLLLIIYSCANRGQGPQGGPKDETPPKLMKSTPRDKAVNVKEGKIELEFDENVNLKDVSKNVVISPPQKINPNIQSYMKRVVVNFKDSLEDNTTYSINFGDAIVDNNESNVLKDFVFAFATGNEIDTLQMSGVLLNAEDLNPIRNVFVGIQKDLNDSAFTTKAFSRITKSGEEGKFTVYNVKNGSYRVYALNDLNRDYYYQPGEAAAFLDSIFETSLENYIRQDTIWKDSLTVDTIKSVPAIRYLPNNIVLKYFNDETKRQYLTKSERTDPHKLSFYFNTRNDSMPTVRLLNEDWSKQVILQKNAALDSLTYWITDSTLIRRDTLTLEIKYFKSDSVFQLKLQTDTVNLFMRKKRPAQSSKEDSSPKFLAIKSNISSSFDVFRPIILSFDSPIKTIDSTKIHLSQLRDTTLVPVDFELVKLDSIGMSFQIKKNWEPENTYQFEVDSAAFFNVYGLHSNSMKNELRIKSLEEYSSLSIVLTKFDSTAVLQVVSSNDKVVRSVPAKRGITKIEYLNPGDYYLRLFLDRNMNGKWDTGSVLGKVQPEDVYYYSKKLSLIKNWEFEETWDHTAVPILLQKPQELKKTVEPNAEKK